MNGSESSPQRRRKVFLSYAQADSHIAEKVTYALRHAGLRVSFDAWELAPGDTIASRIEQTGASSDFLLVLLSRSAVASRWVQQELGAALGTELKDRAIIIIPALIEDCQVPTGLADRFYLDLRHDVAGGIQRLVEQLDRAPDIDFSRLSPRDFENLVADLLSVLGFSKQRVPETRDSGIDLIAPFHSRDPFGAVLTETWLVQIKLYRQGRVSVSSLRKMLDYVILSGGAHKGLVVTNSQMTSAAREFLSESTRKAGRELRVIDGTQLTALLIRYPGLVQRYFRRGGEL